MELLLNIVWLMLAFPGLILCQRLPRSAAMPRAFLRSRSYILVVALLVVVFPVVSATDDLAVTQLEFEELGPAASVLKARHSAATAESANHAQLAITVRVAHFAPSARIVGTVVECLGTLLDFGPGTLIAARAPPLS